MAPFRDGDRQALGALALIIPAATAAGADTHQIDRAMADVVISVANKILRRKFPVTRHVPLLDASRHLRTPLSPTWPIAPLYNFRAAPLRLTPTGSGRVACDMPHDSRVRPRAGHLYQS